MFKLSQTFKVDDNIIKWHKIYLIYILPTQRYLAVGLLFGIVRIICWWMPILLLWKCVSLKTNEKFEMDVITVFEIKLIW